MSRAFSPHLTATTASKVDICYLLLAIWILPSLSFLRSLSLFTRRVLVAESLYFSNTRFRLCAACLCLDGRGTVIMMDSYEIPRKPVQTTDSPLATPTTRRSPQRVQETETPSTFSPTQESPQQASKVKHGTSATGSSSSDNPQHTPDPENDKRQGWWKWRKESVEEHMAKHFAMEFDGKKGFNGHWFRRPTLQGEPTSFNAAALLESDTKGRYLYRNQLGQVTHKYEDVVTYLSPTTYEPRRLLVQATDYVWENELTTGDWRRTRVSGSVPAVLKVAEWALQPSYPNKDGKTTFLGVLQCGLRILVVGLPLQIMLSFPTTASWDDGDIADYYTDFPGYHWKWPKHAINPLDQRPVQGSSVVTVKSQSSRKRLLRPRQLVVLRDNKWVLDHNPDRNLSYVFISYANRHFDTDNSETGRRLIEAMAAVATLKAGKTAYWLDFRCRATEKGPLLDSDVYRMCDVIRGSSQVTVMLKGDGLELKREWGSRMWTLPEALLAPGDSIYFCTPQDDTFKVQSMHKVEMTGSVWEDPDIDNEDGGPTRLLAEHFTGLLTLSRLEILSNAIAALGERAFNNYHSNTQADVAYALMGLLHYRIEKDPDDTLFQAIARLSLANDNDRLIERMVCLYPDPRIVHRSSFEKLARPDIYQTHLWDIEPLCEVVGVADEDNTVLLDNCRAMHIRWKNFPRMNVRRHHGLKKDLAELFVRSGAWWFFFGINLTITYAPFFTFPNGISEHRLILALELLAGAFFAVGLLLSFLGPFSVRRLYGGQVLQSSPNLIGFEGVMPLDKLEKLVFGNNSGRLTYEPSSTPFCYGNRDPKERIGVEPDWIKSGDPGDIARTEAQLPQGHHLFTLVDTGGLSVLVFSAKRPPTVALICGREGGMLRAALCSWRFKNDCLYRETVIRMPSDVYDSAIAKSWLKVCLESD